MRKLPGLIAVAALALSLFGSPDPAQAGNGDIYRMQNIRHGVCLDSNAVGDVYVRVCTVDNNHQRWQSWFGGWSKNVASPSRCLMLMPGWFLRTEPCGESPYQVWQQWDGGWLRNPTDNACVGAFHFSPGIWRYFIADCDFIGGDPEVLWEQAPF